MNGLHIHHYRLFTCLMVKILFEIYHSYVFLIDRGFQLKRFKSIVLSVIYDKEKRRYKEQSGVILYITNQS